MAVTRPLASHALAVAVLGLLAAGCSTEPTYRKEHLANSLQTLFEQDGLRSTVRFLNHTLAVQFEQAGALAQTDNQIHIGPTLDQALQKIIPAVHRVLLSTDAQVQFYVLLVSDPTIPGAYLTMVRYMDDVRRAQANMLDIPEMFSRTVLDLNYVDGQPITLEQYVPKEIKMEEFLSWQLARRIQTKLTEALQETGLAEVGRCAGEFQDGEFAFTLNVVPPGGELDEDTARTIFQAATGVIAKVLSGYRFDSFESVRLVLPTTGRHLVLPKAHLSVFQNAP